MWWNHLSLLQALSSDAALVKMGKGLSRELAAMQLVVSLEFREDLTW